MKRYVNYLATASVVVEVDVPDDTPKDDVAETARELADEAWRRVAPGGLCYQCGRQYDLSEFEQDESDTGVWE